MFRSTVLSWITTAAPSRISADLSQMFIDSGDEMPKAKGSLVVFLRKYLHGLGADVEAQFLNRLTPDEKEVYQTASTASWCDVPVVSGLYEAGAETAFPADPDRMRLLGRASAKHDLTGLFRVYLMLATVRSVIKQTARMWRTYHDNGDARVERGASNQATLVIENYPALPSNLQEMIAGYVAKGLELAGGKNPKVYRDASNPNAWKWNTSWD